MLQKLKRIRHVSKNHLKNKTKIENLKMMKMKKVMLLQKKKEKKYEKKTILKIAANTCTNLQITQIPM